MKRVVLIFLAAGLLFACNDNKNANQSTNKENSKIDKVKNSRDNGANGDKETKKNSTDFTNNDSKNGWSSDQENLFMYECVTEAEKKAGKSAANKYCDCMLEVLKANYSSYNEANLKLGEDSKKMEEIAQDCQPTNNQ